FHFVVLRDRPVLTANASGAFERRLHEFRDGAPGEDHEELRSFAGYQRLHPLGCEAVESGYLVDHLVGEIAAGRFYLGVHLNLVLPQFEVRWEAPKTRIR